MPSRLRPSPDTAHRFLSALDFDGRVDTPHWFQTYDESGQDREPLVKSVRGLFGDCVRELMQLGSAGAGVHVLINETDGNGKAHDNVTEPRACFIDFDDVEPDLKGFPVAPSIVVRSAHGPHVYWLLQRGGDLLRWSRLQLLLAERHEGDPGTRKYTRLQRLPGFLHQKASPFSVGIEHLADPLRRYTLDELAVAWGVEKALAEAEAEERERQQRAEERRNAPRPAARSGPPPIERARKYLAQVEGAPEGSRNEHTAQHVAGVGYDFGIDCEVWIDEVIGWNDANNKPPLPEKEVVAIVRSKYRSLQRSSADGPGWKLNEDSPEWTKRQEERERARAQREALDEASWAATLGPTSGGSGNGSGSGGDGDYDYESDHERKRAAEMRLALEHGVQALLKDDLLTLPCASQPSLDGFPLSTRGNVMRVLSEHKPTLRHSWEMSQWFAWDGARWRKDDGGFVFSLVQKRISKMNEMLKSKKVTIEKPDSEEVRRKKLALREAISKHVNRSERTAAMKEAMELTSWQPTIKVEPGQLDAHDDLLNTRSGVVNTLTLKQRKHDPDQYHTMVTTAGYDSSAECPRWLEFVRWAMCGDEELVQFLQRAVGYSATGHMREQVFFLCYGIGGNGKSTFIDTVMTVLGDYAKNCDIELFLQAPSQRAGTANEELLALRGIRFVYAFEPNEGRALMESRIKQITGGETVTARPLYGKPVEFRPKFCLWLATNHRPVIRGTDDGIWRRVLLIPWKAKITEEQKDDNLKEKLLAEAPGIMRWILEGARQWQRERLQVPEQVRDYTGSYRDEMDLLGAFLDQCCRCNESLTQKSSVLYEVFKAWCESQGERPWKQKTLKERLRERGIDSVKRRGIMTFLGIEVIDDSAEPPSPPHPAERRDVD